MVVATVTIGDQRIEADPQVGDVSIRPGERVLVGEDHAVDQVARPATPIRTVVPIAFGERCRGFTEPIAQSIERY